jgi:hypothetical protein
MYNNCKLQEVQVAQEEAPHNIRQASKTIDRSIYCIIIYIYLQEVYLQ